MFQYPALAAWRDEIRRGERDLNAHDALWLAACAEASALEFANLPALHDRFMDDARRIIATALHEQAK